MLVYIDFEDAQPVTQLCFEFGKYRVLHLAGLAPGSIKVYQYQAVVIYGVIKCFHKAIY